MHAENTKECSDVTRDQGKRASAIYRVRAMARYVACLAGKPEDQWPPPTL